MGIIKHFKTTFNVNAWLGTDHLKKNASQIKSIITGLKNPVREGNFEGKTFQDYVEHYQLTDKILDKRKQFSRALTYFYFGFGLGMFMYMFYQFSHTYLLGGIFSLVLSVLLFAYGLREQVVYMQIKHRQLRVSIWKAIKEWF